VSRRLHLIAGGLTVLLGLVWNLTASYHTARLLLFSGGPAWLAVPTADVSRVGTVRPGSPGDGRLQRGDEIVAVDGRGVERSFEPRGHFAFEPPRPYEILVRRDGSLVRLRLETVPYGFSYASFMIVGFLLVQWIFWAVGAGVFLMRPGDALPGLLARVLLLFAIGFSMQVPLEKLGWPDVALAGIARCVASLFWPSFLHLFLVFPEPSPLLRRFPGLVRWVYVVGSAFTLAMLGVVGLAWEGLPVVAAYFAEPSPLSRLLGGLVGAFSLGGLASLVLSYRSASPVGRRRLGVVVAGCVLGFLPMLGFLWVELTGQVRELSLWGGRLLMLSAIVGLPLIPLSFAYAILKHQVIPVGTLVRRSLRYLLVARGFLILEGLEVAVVLGYLLLGPPAAWLETLPLPAAVLFTMGVTALALGALVLLHRRVMPRIDRRFFREGYDTQDILAEVGQAARERGRVEDVLEVALRRTREALHPESAAAFLFDEETGHYRLSAGLEAGEGVLHADSPVVQRLRLSPAALDTERDGLLLPIVTKGGLLGILSFGPRLGDLPYSRDDRALLGAVAWQMAFAIENARLVKRRAEEERLRREIELAGEVQRRLFPERPPLTRRLELAGVCHPAQGIGGDYYDFLPAGEGRVGIAVADVAGKGISAALLMSIVQAALRSQYRAGASLPELVASMNQLLYRSTARNSFVTFFLAQFDEPSGRLTYVNAGHNPPLLLRAGAGNGDGRTHDRFGAQAGGATALLAPPAAAPAELSVLQTGGLVIGAVAEVGYEAGVVDLGPGDLLVAYTDGITEAFDVNDQEFGEERLREVVLASRDLPAADVAQRIVEAVYAFAGEAPQHDDITLVVARVL
jgi:sigma-B regulation protein RsbU (phosphoserine phosphatase)